MTLAPDGQPMRLQSKAEILARRHVGRSKHDEDVKRRVWTRPVKRGAKAALWPSYEADQLLAAEVGGATETQLRELVERLEAQRQQYVLLLGLAAA